MLQKFLSHEVRSQHVPVSVMGIDLGTSQCSAAVVDSPLGDGGCIPECRNLVFPQPTREGTFLGPLVPSVVAILPDGTTEVGEGPRRMRMRPQEHGLVFERSLFYHCKNEMGLRRTFIQAPSSHDHPRKIAGHVLSFLRQRAEAALAVKPSRTVVTVPASFLVNQRRDTLEAAQLAGIELEDHDLLDEPTAALIDFLITHPESCPLDRGKRNLGMVVDFGGGTCDVTIVELAPGEPNAPIACSLLAASRYHRLGGTDLDAAIVYDHLMPELFRQNNLASLDFGWTEKKRELAPQMLGTAESLKIALCEQMLNLRKSGHLNEHTRASLCVTKPDLTCHLGRLSLTLKDPSLTLARWEELLEPFLDRDNIFARETEYRLTQSLFAPLSDALERSGLEADELTFCLLVGGCSRIPQVQTALYDFLPSAKLLMYESALDAKLCVSRGAAWHAFHLAVTGRPVIQPVMSDALAIITGEGIPLELVPAGTPLPYPAKGSHTIPDSLAVPSSFIKEMKMELRAVDENRLLLEETWKLDTLVSAGDPITLSFRIGASQDLTCSAYLSKAPDVAFHREIQNPLTHQVNPNAVRQRIEDLEEKLRKRPRLGSGDIDDLVALARSYMDIAQHERAIDCLRLALKLSGRADDYLLNLMGIYYGEMGEPDREMKMYREAMAANSANTMPVFNLALSMRKKKRPTEALELIDKAITKKPDGPYYTLRAQILEDLGKREQAKAEVQDAVRSFDPPPVLDDWKLGWLNTAAAFAKDEEKLKEVESERARRKSKPAPASQPEIKRPVIRGSLVKASA